MAGRQKRALGSYFGLQNFGVNLATLAPGAQSSLRHAHSVQDEFVYVIAGTPTLITSNGTFLLGPGQCIGFPGGTGDAHHLINRSDQAVVYLEVGDRLPNDAAAYPDDDLEAVLNTAGQWTFRRKDGTPY